MACISIPRNASDTVPASIRRRNEPLACRRDPDDRRFYDEVTAGRVAELLADDIHRFGYAF